MSEEVKEERLGKAANIDSWRKRGKACEREREREGFLLVKGREGNNRKGEENRNEVERRKVGSELKSYKEKTRKGRK